LVLIVVVSTVAVISVEVAASTLPVYNIQYGTSLVLVQGLAGGTIVGNGQGLVFYSTNNTNGGVGSQLWTVNATDFKTKLVASYTQADDGSVSYQMLDGKSNLYYTTSFPNMTEMIFKRPWVSGTFASRQVIYKDNPCGVPENASCTSGIGGGDLAVAPDGTVYFAENFPSSGIPAGNGTSVIKEVPPGASRATTLLTTRGNSTIDEIAFATKYVYFVLFPAPSSKTIQLDRFVLKSGQYAPVANFSKQYIGRVLIAPSPPVNGVVKKLYYFYRLSRGPLNLWKPPFPAQPSWPAAEGVVGVVPTSIGSCKNSTSTVSPGWSTGLPCGLKAETLPKPRSFEIYYPTEEFQVDSSGDTFQFMIPYATSPGVPTATIVLQWYNPSTGKFTELASEALTDYTPSFTVDSSGNLYWLTSAGAILEIPRV
jgi:hypothetical protein